MSKQTPPTTQDYKTAANLRKIFNDFNNKRIASGLPKLKQTDIAKELEMTQSAVSQFFSCEQQLSPKSAAKFANFFGVKITDIKEDFLLIDDDRPSNDKYGMTKEDYEIIKTYSKLIEPQRAAIKTLIKKYADQNLAVLKHLRHAS